MAEYVTQFAQINKWLNNSNKSQIINFKIKVHDQMPKSDYYYPPIVNSIYPKENRGIGLLAGSFALKFSHIFKYMAS